MKMDLFMLIGVEALSVKKKLKLKQKRRFVVSLLKTRKKKVNVSAAQKIQVNV